MMWIQVPYLICLRDGHMSGNPSWMALTGSIDDMEGFTIVIMYRR